MVAAVSVASQRTPTVIGKPDPLMLALLMSKYNLDKERTLFIGDRLDTDIMFGKNAQIKTLLVLTGVTSEELLSISDIKPDWTTDSVKDLLPATN